MKCGRFINNLWQFLIIKIASIIAVARRKVYNETKNVNNILDVGAGSAWVAQHFKDSEIRVVSLDISLLNVKKAKSTKS